MKKLLFFACASLLFVGCSTEADDEVLGEMELIQEGSNIQAVITAKTQAKSTEKLSSGYKINKAAETTPQPED